MKGSVARARRKSAVGSARGRKVKAKKGSAVAVKNGRGVGQGAEIGGSEAVTEALSMYIDLCSMSSHV